MNTAYVFPGQGAQYSGMGKDLFEASTEAKDLFLQANDILGFAISDIMFNGTEEELKRTSVTQPTIFIHSVILASLLGVKEKANMVAGHSLGEFSALTAAGALSFSEGLKLVAIRANAMQKACDLTPSTMAVVVGLEDDQVVALCNSIPNVSPANFKSPGQLVVSGSENGIVELIEKAKAAGAKMAVQLQVNGAFHSPFMEPARLELAEGIAKAQFKIPSCPVYQNINALPETNPDTIKVNLMAQLTAPVLWTQSVQKMVGDGAEQFIEVGPGKVLQGLIKRISKGIPVESLQTLNS